MCKFGIRFEKVVINPTGLALPVDKRSFITFFYPSQSWTAGVRANSPEATCKSLRRKTPRCLEDKLYPVMDCGEIKAFVRHRVKDRGAFATKYTTIHLGTRDCPVTAPDYTLTLRLRHVTGEKNTGQGPFMSHRCPAQVRLITSDLHLEDSPPVKTSLSIKHSSL
ncbi:hypothetical protein RRG08_041472 [Elysia crispata]|uniref:Uncharacterized protein n=1 Tax=Elysia crispata TaxID=231223 RepID=A0AAE0Y2H4_9GAST|nr:hypothetical protein RRG08_041472 [Elysia crispata]